MLAGWAEAMRRFESGAPIGAAVRAGNDIRADGVASLAPILLQMPQLASLSLAGTLHALVALELWRMVATSGCARMWVHVVSSSACVNQAMQRGRRAEGRWDCAENHIGAAGTASLAPSLVRMTQLTSLNLAGTLHPSVGLEQWRMRGAPAVHGCFCVGRLCAGQKRCSGFGRGAPIGACGCRKYHQRTWGEVAGTDSDTDAAACFAEPRRCTACAGGS